MYVAGALFAENAWEITKNIHRAAAVGFEVAKLGASPIIPHTNTGSVFMGTLFTAFWYEATLELLRRCDAVILVPGWESSKGVAAEIQEADRLHLPVFHNVYKLQRWLSGDGT